jgi:hypothetical protein
MDIGHLDDSICFSNRKEYGKGIDEHFAHSRRSYPFVSVAASGVQEAMVIKRKPTT